MSLSVKIDANTDLIRRKLDDVVARVQPGRDLHRALADGGREVVREHFRTLSLKRNSSGGAGGRKAFYAIARDSTRSVASEREAKVEVTGPRGIRLRLLGGITRPGPGKKFLAIPLVDRLKGVRAGEVYEELGLRPIINRRTGKGILYSGRDFPRVRKGERVTALYALVKKVTHRADPSVMPAEKQVLAGAIKAGRAYVDLVTRRMEGGAA